FSIDALLYISIKNNLLSYRHTTFKERGKMKTTQSEKQALFDAFQKHVDAELRKDLETTLATMSHDPHINNIPTVIGGIGLDNVRHFYSSLIPAGKFFAPDTTMTLISRTIDDRQLVDEIIFKFTHTTEIGWMLPKIAPTGKRVEIPLIV